MDRVWVQVPAQIGSSLLRPDFSLICKPKKLCKPSHAVYPHGVCHASRSFLLSLSGFMLHVTGVMKREETKESRDGKERGPGRNRGNRGRGGKGRRGRAQKNAEPEVFNAIFLSISLSPAFLHSSAFLSLIVELSSRLSMLPLTRRLLSRRRFYCESLKLLPSLMNHFHNLRLFPLRLLRVRPLRLNLQQQAPRLPRYLIHLIIDILTSENSRHAQISRRPATHFVRFLIHLNIS